MNDVGAFELDANIMPDRDMDFVGSLEAERWIWIGIEDLPPPLLSSDGDRQCAIFREPDAARGVEARDR